jgi:hypothetical protein
VQRFLPSLWLLAAALFAAATLLLDHSLYADGPLTRAAANETVRAKEPLKIASMAAATAGAPSEKAASLGAVVTLSLEPPRVEGSARRSEWVQVAGYTTVVHARPSSSSPVILAYPIGQQFRVIAREAGFARVQDLGSGQLGWIEETSLTPLIRGYRVREVTPPEPQVAVAEPSPPRAEMLIRPVKVAAVATPQPPRRTPTMPIPETAPVPETASQPEWEGGIFRKRRDQPELIAAHGHRGELATLVQRAFSGH